jgi:restriction system protein
MSDESEFPKYFEFHWPALFAVREAGGTVTNEEMNDAVVEAMGFDEKQQSILHKDGPQTELEFRIAWARSWLKGMGLIDNQARGIWSTTSLGRSATEADLPELRREYHARMRHARKARDEAESLEETDEAEPDEASEDSWQPKLLKQMLALEPDAFERLAQRLLRAAGFINTSVTQRSGDGGIDGTGDYRLSLITFPVYFQCKRYQGAVGADKVRDFRGAMAGRGDKGMIITTGSFTSSAKQEASRDGAPPIDLIDGDRLCELLKDHELGVTVTTRKVEDVEVRPEFFEGL